MESHRSRGAKSASENAKFADLRLANTDPIVIRETSRGYGSPADRASESSASRTFCARPTGVKGFCRERGSLPDTFLEDYILRVPGHEHDSHARPQLEGGFGQFASAEFRHYHVGHQQVDGALVGFALRQSLAPIAGVVDHIPARLQDLSCEHADHIFVFHQQNDFGALGRRGKAAGRTCSLVRRLSGCRQEDGERGSLTQLRFRNG